MKFSETWLREWVSPALSTEQLVEQITMAGLEVDDVTPVAGEFSGIVVGEVVACERHPEADKLQVTKVNVGADELLDIVCGAANCRTGLKVAVAQVGAVLPGNFKIKKAKLRGQPSNGMLCSEQEMGLADSSDGIIELPQDAPVGQCIREYLQLDDVTIEVDLTPNRADCLGLLGLAREVGTLNDLDLNEPEVKAVAAVIDDTLPIKLSHPEGCPRYLGRVIRGINLSAATPLWMVEKLRRCGIRSIDPVVDVTNFVLLELGQPMHAFDLNTLSGGIDVRLGHKGEKLTLLDGQEVELDGDTLVIADDAKAVAMAGIFGGEATGVTDKTTDVFLECAFFAPLMIAGRARRYGLHTDSSHRYERGVDPQLQMRAMERATQLLLDIVGGKAGPVVEAVSDQHLPAAASVQLRRSRLARVLGISIEDTKVETILKRIGMQVNSTEQGWQAVAPSYRFDIAIEEDLIEEVARVYGYNNIPNLPPVAKLVMNAQREADLDLKRVKALLVDRGFQEAITYSFVDPSQQAVVHPGVEPLILPHPISVEMSAMRLSLWTGLLNALAYNQNRQQARVRTFETGLKFVPAAAGPLQQTPVIAGLISGKGVEAHWSMSTAVVDFFDAKGDVEAILALTNDAAQFSFKAEQHDALHPGQSARIYRDGQPIGWLGKLHPAAAKALDVSADTYLWELEQSALLNRKVPEAVAVSKFPANRRDIALVVKEQVCVGDMIEIAEKFGGNQLVGLDLFDIYRGKGIEDGYKSVAISLVLQDVTRTLEESEIQATVDTIVAALNQEFEASLRD